MFTFNDDEIVELLTKKFVAAATDIHFFEHVKDPVGEFYRKVVTQREGMKEALEKNSTTQGFYIFDSEGNLYSGWNSRGGEFLKKNLKEALQKHKPSTETPPKDDDNHDERRPPKNATVVDVFAKITQAQYPPGNPTPQQKAFRDSVGRDHLWITKGEASTIARGKLPRAVIERIARYHLNDFTRGEPTLWKESEIVKSEMKLEPDGALYKLTGEVELSADRGARGYKAQLYGYVDGDRDRLTRFDIIAKGTFHGFGPYTKNGPPGDFTLVIAFRLPQTENVACEAPPQGVASGSGYMKE